MSLNISKPYLAEHWASVERGAAKTGPLPYDTDRVASYVAGR